MSALEVEGVEESEEEEVAREEEDESGRTRRRRTRTRSCGSESRAVDGGTCAFELNEGEEDETFGTEGADEDEIDGKGDVASNDGERVFRSNSL